MITLSLIHNQTGTFENSCESKDIYTGLDETGPASDYTAAHHKVASCATLNPYYEDGVDKELEAATPKICCYTKLKYKLEGEKFTRKGCTSVDVDDNIDDEINTLEIAVEVAVRQYYSQLGNNDVEIKDIEADIDCHSKFINYSALLILIALL